MRINCMKKLFLSVVMYSLFTSATFADDIKAKVFSNLSERITEHTLGMIPGEGHTEFSFDLRENNSPQYSISAVRQLQELEDGNIFTQFSARNTETQNQARTGDGNERLILNFGSKTIWGGLLYGIIKKSLSKNDFSRDIPVIITCPHPYMIKSFVRNHLSSSRI